MNTIKLQREKLSPTGAFVWFLFTFSCGKLLLIFHYYWLIVCMLDWRNISIPLESVLLVVSTGSYDSVAGCLLSDLLSVPMKKSPGSQKTSNTSRTSLLLLFLSGKEKKKKDRERKTSFTWLFCPFLWEQEPMKEQLLAIGRIAESPPRTTDYCWGASGSIQTVHWVAKFEMDWSYSEEKQNWIRFKKQWKCFFLLRSLQILWLLGQAQNKISFTKRKSAKSNKTWLFRW